MADTWFEGDSTVKRGRFGKKLKPNLTTGAVTAKVEKLTKVKKTVIKNLPPRKRRKQRRSP